jgi:hypothetical protein
MARFRFHLDCLAPDLAEVKVVVEVFCPALAQIGLFDHSLKSAALRCMVFFPQSQTCLAQPFQEQLAVLCGNPKNIPQVEMLC